VKHEQEDIMEIKRLTGKAGEREKQFPKFGADKTMCNTIRAVTTSKTASSTLRAKTGSRTPMITDGTNMGEHDCIPKLPRRSLVSHDEAIDDRAGNTLIEAHLQFTGEVLLQTEIVQVVINHVIDFFLGEVKHIVHNEP